MKELVIVSGKGGTGKTSITACFSSLAENSVTADCDVDAADLHLILNPDIKHRSVFKGGFKARINSDACTECGKCLELCRYDAIKDNFEIDELSCEGCGVCAYFCPEGAIDMIQQISGEWFVSDTRFGKFIHAKLGIGEENSGKLVALVRKIAKINAQKDGNNVIIVDGSPGIGCPVISSITGADYVLIITEPTLSGRHDLERIAELIKHFKVKGGVCINKYDLNERISGDIEKYCNENGLSFIGRVPYDDVFTKAMVARQCVVEYTQNGISRTIKEIWNKVNQELNKVS